MIQGLISDCELRNDKGKQNGSMRGHHRRTMHLSLLVRMDVKWRLWGNGTWDCLSRQMMEKSTVSGDLLSHRAVSISLYYFSRKT